MHKISAVIITFNEEKNIGRCLESIKDIVDEIIVLDSFSADNTEKICKEYNVKFYQHEFDGHIQQKNRALKLAENDFVLSLDADEALDKTLKEEILKVKKEFKSDAYYFNRMTYYINKWIRHTDWYPDRKLRLWNKQKGKWGGTNPHDTVIMQSDTKKMYLRGNILHYSFNSISEHIQQINKFTDIAAKELYKKNKRISFSMIYLKSIWKFFNSFILKLGFLDGYYGYIICRLSAEAKFLKYIKLKELYKKKNTYN